MKKILLFFCLAAFPAEGFCFLFGRAPDKAPEKLDAMRSEFRGGNCAGVLEKAEIFLKEGPSADLKETAYQYMGRCYEREGLADRAISLYKLASGLYPENRFFSARLAGIYLDTGFYENSVALFAKILSVRSDDTEANLGLARAYARLGFLARAKTYYSMYAALTDFGDLPVMREYAAVMLKKRDWPEAEMLTEKGRMAEPANAFWPRTAARIWAGKGDHKKARAHMNSALELSPGSRPLALEKALYSFLSGDTAAAGTEADAALAGAAKDPLASLVKGMALFKEGKTVQARAFFEAALAGGPFTAKIAEAFLKDGGAE